ncbi:MAG: HesA/MoeB/ThiF family protein [Puniceicoccaceae bacterium]|nr:HesA/MoeB/ThiF family protein [Puniceicoccaceae bacterium]
MSYLSRIAQIHASIDLSREELVYYARHILLPKIGLVGQRKLKAARVLIVGAGGLGCPVLQALAGAGVGRLTVVDGDQVAISNLSRQWLHRYADAGCNKAESAASALRALNPFIEVAAHPDMLTSENAQALIESHDLVVDATDVIDARYWIDEACEALDCPWVHAALYRERAQLTVFWASCGASFRKLYPEPSEAPSCSGAGMLGASASLVGNLQALEAIKLITGNAVPKIGDLVSLDATGLCLQSFKIPEVILPSAYKDESSRPSTRAMSVDSLQQALSIHEAVQVLDLRSQSLYDEGTIKGAVHYPAEKALEEGLPSNTQGKVVLVCEEGLISAILADALQHESEAIDYLEGGWQAWSVLNSL